jgi:hypothetical protein
MAGKARPVTCRILDSVVPPNPIRLGGRVLARLRFIFLAFLTCRFAYAVPEPCGRASRTRWPLRIDSSSSLDDPRFILLYTNKSSTQQDKIRLVLAASIIVDGKEYSHTREINFDGIATLVPCQGWDYVFRLEDYSLPRRRSRSRGWATVLKRGEHALAVKIGGMESQHLRFYQTVSFGSE